MASNGKIPLLAGALSLLLTASAEAEQLGLVVGINDYRHFVPFPAPPGEHSDLEGAVNDALRIYQAMQDSGVTIPKHRLLLDQQATLAGFLAAWQDLLDSSTPGDTLIVTYAGHGGQEKEVDAPLDEVTDGLDETLMFHDFDPRNPRTGRLKDDQLQEMLAKSGDYGVSIIWVMDSCHSAGLTRSAASGTGRVTRNGGIWDIPVTPLITEIPAGSGDSEERPLPHVTQILATASEDRQVQETLIDGKAHGALSWYFAEALGGAADLDRNGAITRSEIANYLDDRVFTHMNQNQQPRILPRGDNTPLLGVGIQAPPVLKPASAPSRRVAVSFVGAPPPGLDPAIYIQVSSNPQLVFEQEGDGWVVFNHTGDRITRITGGADRLLARSLALQAVRAAKVDHLPAVQIRADQPHDINHIGQIVGFRFAPPDADHGYLTLFNIASSGALQDLYPAGGHEQPVAPSGFPIRFQVTEPTGADQLVASFCTRPPLELRRLLQSFNTKTAPKDATLANALAQGDCQIAMVGLYTEQ